MHRHKSVRARAVQSVFPAFSRPLLHIVALASLAGIANAAPALPTGGTVASGSATIGAPSNGSLTVNQTSGKAIIDWNSFSIAQGGAVNFNNGAGATLNRVTGNTSSAINGNLNATGSVYLINPNGVIVGKTGVVKVGGNFVASTLDTSDAQFNAGGALTLSGNSTAAVVNYGKIGSLGGDVALVARTATNSGTISAPNGAVGVLAGSQVTLRDSALNDGKFSVDVGSGGDAATNTGTIQAADAELKANGGNVYALAGNTKGVIAATGTTNSGGKVFLSAGGGDLQVTGNVTAQNADGAGGQITARANNISVSGSLDASATVSGKAGGDASVIATNALTVSGRIHARGNNAAGGAIETSGHTLSIDGSDVDPGAGGQWLLDPYDLTVDANAASQISLALNNGADVTIAAEATGTLGEGTANPSGNGDVFIDSAISWTGSTIFTVNATRNIVVNAAVTTNTGTINLNAANTIAFNAPVSVTGAGQVRMNAGVDTTTVSGASLLELTFAQGAALNFTGGATSGATLTINSASYTLLYSLSAMENINSTAGTLGGDYALATSLDATNTTGWTPVGENAAFTGIFDGLGHTISNLSVNSGNAGLFGLSQGTIRNINLTGETVLGQATGGLVGLNEGTVAYASVDATVQSNGSAAGGLVGDNDGPIFASSSTGAVTGVGDIGGLVGDNSSTIADSYSMAVATGTSRGDVGGLVGDNFGTITASYATGAVSGGASDGGLVGAARSPARYSANYWDASTSGQSFSGDEGAAITGDSTSELQGTLPSGFSTAIWGSGTGLYPYLLSKFPNGVQAVTGKAYSDAGVTPLASGASGVVTIAIDANGGFAGHAETGVNGVYYIALPAGTIANNANVLAYVASGASSAATLSTVASASGDTAANLYGGLLAEVTTATSLSQVTQSSTAYRRAAVTAAGSDTAGSAAINAATLGVVATGASFTIDTSPSSFAAVETVETGAPLTVTVPITLSGANLALTTSGALAIDAPITVTDGGQVSLTAGVDTTTVSGASLLELTFAQGDSLDFTGGASSGAALSINGTSYTLLYSLSAMETMNLSGDYALATSFDATGVTGWTPVGENSAFTGIFDGLGNTIANLSVSAGNAGLFGLSRGTIRNINLTDESVSGLYAGGVVASSSGTIAYVSVDATVQSNGSGAGGVTASNGGTIFAAASTGSVSGNAFIGGLAGSNSGAIADSYSMAVATGASGADVGGLVGDNLGSITASYATGAVGGGASDGGLVGAARSPASYSHVYWDASTTGQSGGGDAAIGGDGRSTSQLQGTLQTGFSATIWGTGNGLYPYLLSQFHNGVQAVSGTVTTRTNAAVASGVNGVVTVGLDGPTGLLTTANTGANGYYYAFVPANTFQSADDLLVYTNANAATGATNDFAQGTWHGGTALNGLNIRVGTTTINTADTTLSATLSDFTSGLTANDPNAAAALAGSSLLVIASGASFTVDEPVTVSNDFGVKTTTVGAPLTIADPVILNGAHALSLMTSGALAIDAPMMVTGGAQVTLVAGKDTTTVPGVTLLELSFASGDGLDFTGGASSGARLSIDSTTYTLVYSMSSLQTIGLSGNYALATSLDASQTSNWTPIGPDSSDVFAGTFEGLGHTIANLTIDEPASDGVGLFGFSSGTLRDIALVDESLTADTAAGGLVYQNEQGGVIANASVNAAIQVSGVAGGIAASNDGTIFASSSTGSVSASSATSSVIGGIAGESQGDILDSYSMMSVTGVNFVGGLVGENFGTITDAYATGVVIGTTRTGGAIGSNSGTGTNVYWDTTTSGRLTDGPHLAGAAPSTADTTAQLQGTLPSGFDPSVWGTGPGLYPYLLAQYPVAPQVIAGTAYSDAGRTPLQAQTVSAFIAGTEVGAFATGADGSYYVLVHAGTVSPGGTAVAALTADGARIDTPTASVSDFDIWGGGTLIAPTAAATFSAASATSLQAQDASLIGTVLGSDAAAAAFVSGLGQSGYIALNNFTLDTPPVPTSALYIKSDGNLTVTSALTLDGAGALTLDAVGALAIDAPITVAGGGAVSLGAGTDTTTVFGASLLELSFAQGDSIDFTGGATSGATLSIDNAPYTLVYSVSSLETIGVSGNSALATSLDMSQAGNWTPIGPGTDPFTGTFEGLGHTIANLTIDEPPSQGDGLFNQSSGTLRDINLVDESITGNVAAGGLLNENQHGGVVANASVNVTIHVSGVAGGIAASNEGTIFASSSTGSVSAYSATSSVIGGLAGQSQGIILDSYSMMAVTGVNFVGGLVGENFNKIIDSYATGVVIGTTRTGGAIGSNSGLGLNIYWDTTTSGRLTDGPHLAGEAPSTADTTAQLQGTLPSGFDPSIWGTGPGLYPYLKSQYPNDVQAISGTVTGAANAPIGSGANGAVSVGIDTTNGLLTTATAGANGYYYAILPAGTFQNGNAVLAYTDANAATGANNGFVMASWSGNSLSNANITTAQHTLTTTDTALSQALADYTGGITTKDANALAAVAGSPLAITATGTSFTIDIPIDITGNYAVTTTRTNAPIVIASAITLDGASTLTLDAQGALAIDATVAVPGAGAVTLDTGLDTTTVPGTSLTALSFGTGGSLDFGSVDNGASLVVNGTPYTLVYNPAELAAIDNSGASLDGDYALATALTLSGSWTPLGTDGAGTALNGGLGFAGIFEGLGNALGGLSVNTGANNDAGLFGLSDGTIRDLTVSGTVTGTIGVGGLVGANYGVLANDSAAVAVTGGGNTGGLAGRNSGTIVGSSASGIVGATNETGGLVGWNTAAIVNSSASGSVTSTSKAGGLIGENDGTLVANDRATGTVSGGQFVGGFVGYNGAGAITGSTAGGAVSGSVRGAGGFAGFNNTGDTLSNDSASGAVTGTAIALAGFAGINYGTVTGDTETGAVGDATATGNIGGLVGHNFGTVSLSSAKGNVQGQNAAGGLVGINSGTVQQSFSSGTVTGKTKTGGLIGENDATVENVYETGQVTGTQYVGGLVGWNQGSIDYAYASGAVSGTANVAGFAGNNVNGSGTFLDDYFNAATTGQARAVGNGSSAVVFIGGLHQPDPTLQSTYAGFDFSAIWVIASGQAPTLNGVP